MAAFTWTFYEQVGSWGCVLLNLLIYLFLEAGDSDNAVHDLS